MIHSERNHIIKQITNIMNFLILTEERKGRFDFRFSDSQSDSCLRKESSQIQDKLMECLYCGWEPMQELPFDWSILQQENYVIKIFLKKKR